MQALLNLDPIFWVLIILSVATVSVSILKAWQLFTVRNIFSDKKTNVTNDASRGKKNIRLTLMDQYSFAANKMQLHGNALETEMWRMARIQVGQFSDYLKVLEVVATVAPLIGLLGTVLGMVEAFKAMELAGANVDPAVLSGGIWKALSTTAAGLIVAIPAFMIHSWLDSKAEKIASILQNDLEFFLAQAAQAK